LKNKKTTLAFLVVGLTLISMAFVGYASAAEELPGIPAVVRAHGVAIARVGENEPVLMPAHMALRGLLFKPTKIENLTVGRLAIKDGILVINETKYNITRGIGALVLERHDIILTANGTSPSGENFCMRLRGKWFKVPDGPILLMNMTGTLKFENDGKLLLFLRGSIFPKPPLQQTT